MHLPMLTTLPSKNLQSLSATEAKMILALIMIGEFKIVWISKPQKFKMNIQILLHSMVCKLRIEISDDSYLRSSPRYSACPSYV